MTNLLYFRSKMIENVFLNFFVAWDSVWDRN
jgi:hypothetical protein